MHHARILSHVLSIGRVFRAYESILTLLLSSRSPPLGMCVNLKSMWTPKVLEESKVNGKRTFSAHVDAPTDGRYVAYFIDIVYALNKIDALIPFIGDKHFSKYFAKDLAGRLQFTTEVSVFPNTFPYVGCGITDGVDTGIPCTLDVV
jgi:hypothetical protein